MPDEPERLQPPPPEPWGDLLDFTPVPRRKRGDGWRPELQKLFIAALARTGSRTRAAAACGKSGGGIDRLLAAEGAAPFRAAYHRALALYEERSLAQAATRMADLGEAFAADLDLPPVRRAAPPAPPPPPPPPPKPPVLTAEDIERKVVVLRRMRDDKLEAEASYREQGRFVEANFTLRQVTRLDVMIELSQHSEPATVDAFIECLATASGTKELNVLDTDDSRATDAARRAAWAEEGAAERPRPLPGPGNARAAEAGIEEKEDCRTWCGSLRGGPDFKQRLALRTTALWFPEFDGERE